MTKRSIGDFEVSDPALSMEKTKRLNSSSRDRPISAASPGAPNCEISAV